MKKSLLLLAGAITFWGLAYLPCIHHPCCEVRVSADGGAIPAFVRAHPCCESSLTCGHLTSQGYPSRNLQSQRLHPAPFLPSFSCGKAISAGALSQPKASLKFTGNLILPPPLSSPSIFPALPVYRS